MQMNGENIISAFKKVRLRFSLRTNDPVDKEDAEDALQDAFCRLWARKESLEATQNPEALFLTTARNIRIDGIRKKNTQASVSIDGIKEIPDDTGNDDDVTEVYNAVDRLASEHLSVRDREILFHRERDGWDFSDLAQHYGLSKGNIRLIVSRARKTLRALYNQNNKG